MSRQHFIAVFIDEVTSEWLAFAALAFIYGSAVMTIVIVTLLRSARRRGPESNKKH